MSSPAISFQSKGEQYAFNRRRNYSNIKAMIMHALAYITEATDVELPSEVEQTIYAIQAAHGGGRIPLKNLIVITSHLACYSG